MKKSNFILLMSILVFSCLQLYSAANNRRPIVNVQKFNNIFKQRSDRFSVINQDFQKINRKKLVLKKNSPQDIKIKFDKLVKKQRKFNELLNNYKSLLSQMKSTLDKINNERKKREEYQTMFEDFDKKAKQLYDTLSNAMKQINEMRSSISRNLL